MLWTDFSSEQLSCDNGTSPCVGTDARVVKTQHFLQALIMHHRVPISKGQWYHTVKVYNCIWKVPDWNVNWDAGCPERVFYGFPQSLQANSRLVPWLGHARVLQDPLQLIDLPTIWYYIIQDTYSFVKQTTKKNYLFVTLTINHSCNWRVNV
jgi:hypothetical protein